MNEEDRVSVQVKRILAVPSSKAVDDDGAENKRLLLDTSPLSFEYKFFCTILIFLLQKNV